MRLIDADAYIQYCDEKWIPLNVDAVNAQPPIEPERKRGKWDTFFSDSYKVHEIGVECSCCGYRTQERTTYCPNCGADMRGNEDDQI